MRTRSYLMSKEDMQIRVDRLREDLEKVLAANAANSAYIDKIATMIKARLEVLGEDVEKLSEKC